MLKSYKNYKCKTNLLLTNILIFSGCFSYADSYKRSEFSYKSYKPSTSEGFYTGKACDFINIDHVVSLKDAYTSGALYWSHARKKYFANDKFNHVPSCKQVNSSKGSAGPADFLRRSEDGKGFDYKIVRFCEYVRKYYAVKVKYGLSFYNNSHFVFNSCGVDIEIN